MHTMIRVKNFIRTAVIRRISDTSSILALECVIEVMPVDLGDNQFQMTVDGRTFQITVTEIN